MIINLKKIGEKMKKNKDMVDFINNFSKVYNKLSLDDFKNIVNENNINCQNEYGYTILMMTIFY